MKAREFIDYIKRNKLEEYNMHFITHYIKDEEFGYIGYDDLHICDVGHGDKEIMLAQKD